MSNINQKKFVIIIPSYNNEKWAEKNIISALDQDYENYRILFIDDCSADNTSDIVKKTISSHKNGNKCILIKNNDRKGSLHNIYSAVHSCDDDEIIVMLDGDDWLADNKVLSYLNKEYCENDLWMTYGQFKDYPNNRWCSLKIPDEIIEKNHIRYAQFTASHLKTFYSWLFKKIALEDLFYEGKFAPMAGDVAFMTPMLEMAGKKSKFIDKVLYIYNSSNPINDHSVDRELQIKIDYFIKSKPRYNCLNDNQFILKIIDNGPYSWLNIDLSLNKKVFLTLDKLAIDKNADINILLQVEPMGVAKQCYGYDTQDIINNYEKWNYILTWNEELLKLPNSIKFEYGSTWLKEPLKSIEKNNLCSIICGDKSWMPGHIKRIEIFNSLINNNNFFKFYSKNSSWKKFKDTEYFFELDHGNTTRIDPFKSQFHLVIENCSEKNYFSEKLLDCFLTNTIPIYWGAPNISDYFNIKGMLFLDDFKTPDDIINYIDSIDIQSMIEYIDDNYNRALTWCNFNERLKNKIIDLVGA